MYLATFFLFILHVELLFTYHNLLPYINECTYIQKALDHSYLSNLHGILGAGISPAISMKVNKLIDRFSQKYQKFALYVNVRITPNC